MKTANFNFTPGPWHILTRRPAIRITTEGSPNVEPENVATIPIPEFRDATPEQLANARLLAAAPELLAALINVCEQLGFDEPRHNDADWVKQARAALKMAISRGE